jgi:hypothetical protein
MLVESLSITNATALEFGVTYKNMSYNNACVEVCTEDHGLSIKDRLDKKARNEYQCEPYVYTMPGKDTAPNCPYCGQFIFLGPDIDYDGKMHTSVKGFACPDHKENDTHTFYGARGKCFNRHCPVCAPFWAYRAAKDATIIIAAKFDALSEAGITTYIHGIDVPISKMDCYYVSPPQVWGKECCKTDAGAKELYKKLYEIMDFADCIGGAAIFHMCRQKIPEYIRQRDYDHPQEAAPKECPDWGYYCSPHFHIIGCGYIKGGDIIHKNTGWVVHKTPWKKDSWKMNLDEKLNYTLGYNIGHCAIPKSDRRYQVVRYFGLFSNNKFKKTETYKYEYIDCSVCRKHLNLVKIPIRMVPDELRGQKIELVRNKAVIMGEYHFKVRVLKYEFMTSKYNADAFENNRFLLDDACLKHML